MAVLPKHQYFKFNLGNLIIDNYYFASHAVDKKFSLVFLYKMPLAQIYLGTATEALWCDLDCSDLLL
jgi:hypothetical protein